MIEFKFDPSPSLRMVTLLSRATADTKKSVDRATLRLATELQNVIVRRLRAGRGLAPLAASTKAMKKSSKPLINHGDLLGSIKYRLVSGAMGSGQTTYFIGVHRSAYGRDGQALANVAEIHEFGTEPYTITVTGRMRAFWMYMLRKKVFTAPLKATTMTIHHPGIKQRSFLRKPYESWLLGSDWNLAGSIANRSAQERWAAYIEQYLEPRKKTKKGGSGGGSGLGALFASLTKAKG